MALGWEGDYPQGALTARAHFREAIRIAPGVDRYRQALATLETRQRDAVALRR